MAEMEEPTRTVHDLIRRCNRVIQQLRVDMMPPTVRNKLIADLRSWGAVPEGLSTAIPPLAEAGHHRWLQWSRAAGEAGNALAAGFERGDRALVQQAFQMVNALPGLKHQIISPEMEMWCLPDEVLEVPITEVEHAEMLRVRKSNDYPKRPSPEWDRWTTLTFRHLFQFPSTLDREMWHEAGHIVVGHRLGWQVQRIDRHSDGTPHAIIPPPCEFPELPILDFSTVAVAGYLAEDKAFGNAMPGQDHVNLAREFQADAARQGRTASPTSNLAHVLEAEARAEAILDENWGVVRQIAELATASLPVRRKALLGEQRGVAQDEPRCGARNSRVSASGHRRQSLLTTRGVQARTPRQ
jgi:hypothetical protein